MDGGSAAVHYCFKNKWYNIGITEDFTRTILMSGINRIDDNQIKDGNIGMPDFDHYEWTLTASTASNLPLTYSGTKISGDKEYYWIKQINRDTNDIPYQFIDSIYRKASNTLRWQKQTYIVRNSNGIFTGTSGTIITGENTD